MGGRPATDGALLPVCEGCGCCGVPARGRHTIRHGEWRQMLLATCVDDDDDDGDDGGGGGGGGGGCDDDAESKARFGQKDITCPQIEID